MPLTTLTVIRPDDLGDLDPAATWLSELRADEARLEAEIEAALALINLAVHAHRAATLDPAIADVATHAALALRVGVGTGDQHAEGADERARELPVAERRRRAEVLRPQERVADVLGGRGAIAACELLVIRSRADLDSGRRREAALQLRAALDAMLAERPALEAPDQEPDFAELERRRDAVTAIARRAESGELDGERVAEVEAALRIAERVLRRKRALG